MLYGELRNWLIDFLEKHKNEKVPLFTDSYTSPDIRIKISMNITLIDEILNEKSKGENKRFWMAKAKKKQLIAIKVAIENKQHDVSEYHKIELKWTQNTKKTINPNKDYIPM